MVDRIGTRTWVFMLVSAGIASAALILAGRLQSLQHPEAIAFGLALDLTLVLPLAYYILILRPLGRSPVAAIPAVVAGAVFAALLLLPAHREPVHAVRAFTISAGFGLALWIGWRAGRALKRVRRSNADPLEVLNELARGLVGSRRVASIIASEMAVVYFAIGSWRQQGGVGSNSHAVSSRNSGHGGIVFALLLVVAVECTAAHFLLARWSPMLAWAATLITLYGALWLFADYRATVLRPVLVGPLDVYLRAGLRWYARVPRAAISEVSRTPPESVPAVALTFGTQPNAWIHFSAPVLLQGLYGTTRPVRSVGLFADSPANLQNLLAKTPLE